jgi:glutamate 5-kinase
MRRVVVKLGSSIVAHADGGLRANVLARICDAVAALHAAGDDVVLVSSGAIARGMQVLELPARPTSIAELQAASAVGQGKLYRFYDELLRERAVTSAQVLLTIGDLAARTQYLNARHTLAKLLEWKVVAVVNENDTTATDEISFGDNDFLAAQVAMLVSADLLVLLTDIDGLYTADPRIDPDAELVREVHDFDALQALEIGATTSPLGSGGMRSKVVAADIATAAGIATVICNGVRPGVLEAMLRGSPEGTTFTPRSEPHSSFKLWLKYAKPAHGTLVIDAGAARALREGGTSLLPVGIVAVVGDFDAGDAVEIAERGGGGEAGEGAKAQAGQGGGAEAGQSVGAAVGKGLCNYSAQELRQVAGLQSGAVRELLPHATEEAVHRDHLVLS